MNQTAENSGEKGRILKILEVLDLHASRNPLPSILHGGCAYGSTRQNFESMPHIRCIRHLDSG